MDRALASKRKYVVEICYKFSALCIYRVLFVFIEKSVKKEKWNKQHYAENIESLS